MTDGCPGYDRILGACLVHPDDCGLSPAAGEDPQVFEVPVAPAPHANGEATPEADEGERSGHPERQSGVAS